MTDDEREDREALRWYAPGGKVTPTMKAGRATRQGDPVRVDANGQGITVTVSLNGHEPQQPTRYALMMRRRRANMARKQQGQQQKPAILAGSCGPCEGLGVVGTERERCPSCNGSGMR